MFFKSLFENIVSVELARRGGSFQTVCTDLGNSKIPSGWDVRDKTPGVLICSGQD